MRIEIDTRDFGRVARKLQAAADQIPYALQKAMNDSAFKVRDIFINETWPQSVTQRNTGFLRSHISIDKASKHNLTVKIVEAPSTVSLARHAEGGTKTPMRAKTLSIPPTGSVSYGPRGIRADQKPGAILRNTSRRALRVTAKGIFVGEGGRLHLRYSFKPSAQQPQDVAFESVFEREMMTSIRALMPNYLAAAMRTRK
jgi:hypothetical protein